MLFRSVLESIRERSDVPLVLHGGTGSSEANFRRCIASGVRKINIATAFFMAAADAARQAPPHYFEMSGAVVRAVREIAETHIRLFGISAPQG